MSLTRLRSKLHRRHKDPKDSKVYQDDQFYDISEEDYGTMPTSHDEVDSKDLSSYTTDQSSFTSHRSSFTSEVERLAYEEQLTQLQEQLVATTIENQLLATELKQYKGVDVDLTSELEILKQRNRDLEEQLRQNEAAPGLRRRHVHETDVDRPHGLNNLNAPGEVLPAEPVGTAGRGRLEVLWERAVETLYNVVDDCSDLTRPLTEVAPPVQSLTVKTLKENIRRFKCAIKPYTDTVKGLQNLMMWQSRSYTFLAFCIYMFVCWHGWFLPLVFFLASVRMAVTYLHSKDYTFRFDYFPVDEEKPTTDDVLGLSEKFNLVIQVATKVQNALGSAADGLEKIKNLLTWRHQAGSRKLFTVLCCGCVMFAIVPTSVLWKFIGLGLGVKLFIVNFMYNKYPRMKRRWDSNYKLWQSLPTDTEYDRQFVRAEMDRYIMVPSTQDEVEREVCDSGTDSEHSSDEDSDSEEFRQLFSLPVSECLLKGWSRGKRAVLIGKDRSLVTLLSKKRGKLYLTKSFLCFEREKSPSVKNIVIPLVDIVSIDKVKINQRFPGKGMAIQIIINSDGKDNVLQFGGIIGRDGVVKGVEEAIKVIQREGQMPDNVSRRSISTESSSSRIQNFTFGAYYEDSE